MDLAALVDKMKPSKCSADIVPTDSMGATIAESFNISLSTGVIPSFFKHAVVEPVYIFFKPTWIQQNYNISDQYLNNILTQAVSKSCGRAIFPFLHKDDILDKFQSGFHKANSTKTVS